MICSDCGRANDIGNKFCAECGRVLAAACPMCGVARVPGAKFCGACGASLPNLGDALRNSGERVSPDTPVAERRHVSVLFVDLVGFTSFAEGRDAEEVRDALSRYFDIARTIVHRYGGTIEKFIGDAVMAVWGTPLAHEDDAERAVRAALELVDAVGDVGPGIDARGGVLTGEAAVTIGAKNEGMVAGDLVNTAARLQSAAAPGAVLVGDTTQRATSLAIAYESVGAHQLKGKDAPVSAWRALRVVAEVGGKNRSGTLEAPFVGRDDELRLLKDLFHATGRERRARLVHVSAPPGFGKSRLAWELSKYVDGLVEPVWWHAGRSPAYGGGITLWPIGEMVRERAGLAETDDETTTRGAVAATVREWIPDPDEQRWVESALLALLGVEAITGGPERLFGAWRTFFERISKEGTVALVFEDLHWADQGTLDFIDHLTEWSRGVPLFILTMARPELLERRPDWTSGRRSVTSIALDPLPDHAMVALLDGLMPGLPEPMMRRIIQRAEGVPLYAVETVRTLLADGTLVPRAGGDTLDVVGDLSEWAVPETLTALIAARLDGLEPAERGLVADAAVLGQSFTPAGLAAVAGITLPELEPSLRTLVRREILTQAVDPRSPERGQYAFMQALIREVAYNTLAHRDRRSRHLAAARFFESLGSDELAGALAGHLVAAVGYSTPGPEADAVGGQARIALLAAAERAAGLGAHDQAVTHFEQALTVTTDPAGEADLRERAGRAASDAGQHDRAEAFLRRALEIRKILGDPSAIARATAALGEALLFGGRTDAAVELLGPAMDATPLLSTDPSSIQLSAVSAQAMVLSSNSHRAIEIADRVLAAAEQADMIATVAETLVSRGSALGDLGRSYEGIGSMRTGLELARSIDMPITVLRALNNIAVTQISLDPVASLRAAREALDEARRLSLKTWISLIVANAAEAAHWTGEWSSALEEASAVLATDLDRFDRATLLTGSLPIRSWRGESIDAELSEIRVLIAGAEDSETLSSLHAALSHQAFAAGRLEEARAEALERGRLSPINAPAAYFLAAHAALWSADVSSARSDLASLEGTHAHGPAITLHKMTIRAGIAALDGRAAEALAAYRDVLHGWRTAGLPVLEAITAIDMATLLDVSLPEVVAAGDNAREIFIGLTARPFLQRLEEALSQPAKLGSHKAIPQERVFANEA